MITNEELTQIKERVEETSFKKAYVKGDLWKGYEVKNDGNGLVIAELPCGTDAEFIAYAREDVSRLVAEVERLQKLLRHDSWKGKTLVDGYCNGYFGGQQFHFEDAIVFDESPLTITVRRYDGRFFTADFDSAEEKHECMLRWTSEEETE